MEKVFTTTSGVKYEILEGEKLGNGNYGNVFKGKNVSTGKVVAIKNFFTRNDPYVQKRMNERARNEMKALYYLQGHKEILGYVDEFQHNGNLYMVTELCQENLCSFIQGKDFKEHQAKKYVKQ